MMLLMFRIILILLALSENLNAQTVITNTDRLSWTQSATSLVVAQSYSYIVYIDDTIRRSLENVICSGSMSPFSCNSKFPPFATAGVHNLQLTAIDVAESAKSNIFQVQVNVPSTPGSLGIVNNVDPTPSIFIDNSLLSNCLNTYNSTTRLCGGGTAKAYNTIIAVGSICSPGDLIAIRGGTYNITQAINISCSGLSNSRITFTGYKNEQVIIKGPYDVDTNGNGIRNWDEDVNPVDGNADGPGGSFWFLSAISGNYITFKNIRLQWGYYGLEVSGSNNIIEEVIIHDCWHNLFLNYGGGDNNIFRYDAAIRSRHGSGMEVDVASSTDITTGTIFYRNLIYKNGRQLPNDARVSRTIGDPTGGGNSDGLVVSKFCLQISDPDTPICNNLIYQENIMWSDTDGCMDLSTKGSAVINNIAYNCEVTYKIFLYTAGYYWSGNIAIGDNPTLMVDRNFELRPLDDNSGQITYGIHNLGTRSVHANFQLLFDGMDPSKCFIFNNLMWGGGSEYNIGSACTVTSNYDGDISGTPKLENETFDSSMDVAGAESCLINAPHITKIRDCWQQLYNSYYNAYKPAVNSAIINAGTFHNGIHCPLADDKGQDIKSSCRHWTGTAPDLGPFEFGILGNPDKTKCIETESCN